MSTQQQPQQEPVVKWESIEAMAAERYKVVPSHGSMFYRHAVVAGDGTRQLYIGRKIDCQNMATKFANAFLDGAFAMRSYANQPQQEPVAFLVEGLGDEGLISHQLFFNFEDAKNLALAFSQHYPTVKTTALIRTQPQRQPLTDELPSGFVPLQKRNGKLVYAACMDSNSKHFGWLMGRHPSGGWVCERKLANWELMQVEDQEYYGIVQEATLGIGSKA